MIKIANCTQEEFVRRISAGKVICFGAGEKFIELYKRCSLEDRVPYVVDNYKSGTEIQIRDRKISVRSITELDHEVDHAILVVTSTRYAFPILRQLDSCERLHHHLVFYPYDMVYESPAAQIDCTRKQVIPKKIHYCWFGGGDMPPRFQKNIDTWRKYCPDYEIVRWDENNYDMTKNRYMRQACEKHMWGYVSDYARLDVINQYGGIYLDTDVEAVRSFDSLLGYGLFCGFQDRDYVNFGVGFGAKSGHPILEELLGLYGELSFINKDGSLNLTTCPIYQTQILERHGLQSNGMPQRIEDCLVLSAEYFSPFNMFGFGWVTEQTFSIHQYAGSWEKKNISEKEERNLFFMNRMEKLECEH